MTLREGELHRNYRQDNIIKLPCSTVIHSVHKNLECTQIVCDTTTHQKYQTDRVGDLSPSDGDVIATTQDLWGLTELLCLLSRSITSYDTDVWVQSQIRNLKSHILNIDLNIEHREHSTRLLWYNTITSHTIFRYTTTSEHPPSHRYAPDYWFIRQFISGRWKVEKRQNERSDVFSPYEQSEPIILRVGERRGLWDDG